MSVSSKFDATVVVRDGREGMVEIPVNRAVLTFDSTYFAERFRSDTDGGSVGSVTVEDDVASDALRLLLSVCHDSNLSNKKAPKSLVAQASFELAKQFGFTTTTRKHLLRLRILTASERDQYMVYEKEWDLSTSSANVRLWDVLARRHFSVFYMSALSRRNLLYVLESPELTLGYRDMLRLIIEWKKIHPHEGRYALDDLLAHARFDTLSDQEVRVLIRHNAMPYGEQLRYRQATNRRYLSFVHFGITDSRGYETLYKVRIPNFDAPLNPAVDVEKNGVVWINLPLTMETVRKWEFNSHVPLILARLSVTLGNYALSIWLFANQGALCVTVVIDRRLSGNKDESLEDSLRNLIMQCFVSSKTHHIPRGKFDINQLAPATDAARSKTLARNAADWDGALTCKVIHANDVRGLMYHASSHSIKLQTLVDVRFVKPLDPSA